MSTTEHHEHTMPTPQETADLARARQEARLSVAAIHNQLPPEPHDPNVVLFEDGPGVKHAESQKIVAHSVTIKCTCKVDKREFDRDVPAHEFPLIQRLYRYLGGTVTPTRVWPAGVDRVLPISYEALVTENKRLAETFVHRSGDAVIRIYHEVYGPTDADAQRGLHAMMRRLYEAWRKLEAVGRQRAIEKGIEVKHPMMWHRITIENLTDDEIAAWLAIACPPDAGDGHIALDPEALAGVTSEAPAEAPKAPAIVLSEGAQDGAADDEADAWANLETDLVEAGVPSEIASEAVNLARSGDDGLEHIKQSVKGKPLTAAIKVWQKSQPNLPIVNSSPSV